MGRPLEGPFAWDWAEVTDNPAGTAVTIWRGTAGDPREEIVLLLSGGYPDEIADWLETLAFIIRSYPVAARPGSGNSDGPM